MSRGHVLGRRSAFLLTLTSNGGATLQRDDESGLIVWASDSDEDFMEEFPEFLDENDTAALLEYLVDEGYMTDAEADRCEIDIESLEAEGGPGDDEDDEDDDGDDFAERGAA